jgi:hypothetical protein
MCQHIVGNLFLLTPDAPTVFSIFSTELKISDAAFDSVVGSAGDHAAGRDFRVGCGKHDDVAMVEIQRPRSTTDRTAAPKGRRPHQRPNCPNQILIGSTLLMKTKTALLKESVDEDHES